MSIAGAPEQRAARLDEAVERADEGEVAERLFLQSDAPGEVIEAAERPALALADDRVRFGGPEALHFREPEPHVVDPAGAMARDRLRGVGDVRRDRRGALFDDGLLG